MTDSRWFARRASNDNESYYERLSSEDTLVSQSPIGYTTKNRLNGRFFVNFIEKSILRVELIVIYRSICYNIRIDSISLRSIRVKKLREWFRELIGTYKGLLIVALFVIGIRFWELTSISVWFIVPSIIFLFFGVLFVTFYCLDNRE